MITSLALGAVLMATAPIANEVTVYNQGFGLVKETRSLPMRAGRQTVAVEDVAAMIEPATVAVKGLGEKNAFSVLEQNYQYDLISPQAILSKSVGQRVRLIRTLGGVRDVLEGVLISAPYAVVGTPEGGNQMTYNGVVIRTDDGRIVLNPTGEIEVREVPKGLISKPTLLWEIEAAADGDQKVEVSYLTRGMNWSADYVLTLNVANGADLKGWVTIDNQSGASFENAKLKLLAGEVNRVDQGPGGMGGGIRTREMMAMDAAKQFEEQSLFEYHLYTLQRPATVRNRETKQISLLEGTGVPFQRRLIVDATRAFGYYRPGEGEIGTGDIKPQARIEFKNDQNSGLGMPLPKGRVRIYQRDDAGSVQMLGEDQIDHTPRNERISLVVGRAFDVVASRHRKSFERVATNVVRETFEIEVRNRKTVDETVEVLERHWGDWRVTAKSQEFTKEDSQTMRFVVRLKPDETKKVTYTVETRW